MRRLAFFALILISSMAAVAAPSRKLPIEKEVERLVALFSDGVAVEYPKSRHIEFGKIFGSEREDAIVLFSIEGFEGSNYHAEYLAFFESIEKTTVAGKPTRPFRLIAVTQIGGKRWRSFDGEGIKFGTGWVRLSGKKYGHEDADCCPTVPIQVTFCVKDGFISESK